MSDDKLIEWLLPFSMEELLDLESKLKNKIRSLERERAREAARQKKAAEAERLKREAEQQAAEAERLKREAEEQARRQAEEDARRREEAERLAAAKKPRPLPTNLYASVDQLAANQGLDISGLMSEIAKKTAKKPAPPGKGGNGRR